MPKPQPVSQPFLLRVLFFASLLVLMLTHTSTVHAQETRRAIVSRTRPEYPALALRMHISGSVLVMAKVKADGTVAEVRAMSGHAFLQGPAEQAVRQWRFARASAPSDTMVEVRFEPASHS